MRDMERSQEVRIELHGDAAEGDAAEGDAAEDASLAMCCPVCARSHRQQEEKDVVRRTTELLQQRPPAGHMTQPHMQVPMQMQNADTAAGAASPGWFIMREASSHKPSPYRFRGVQSIPFGRFSRPPYSMLANDSTSFGVVSRM
ncbi:hypothetical protein PG997_009150 [Apiospora hydei]|uniref:Uncharacterized protein n=1 Tax=Apiospora hydei TaxID=1337664 RepID=A0ABR1VTI8_9PEZI